jgi:membrane associated rhomboid family serine protease
MLDLEPVVELFRTPYPAVCSERILVLQAVGIRFEIVQAAGDWVVFVAERDAQRAAQELRHYTAENRRWTPQPRPVKTHPGASVGSVIYMFVILSIGWAASRGFAGLHWFRAGRFNAGQFLDGEWWRAITALTLHADLGHVASNMAFGMAFGYFVGQLLGPGLAWSSILLAGTLGNTLNALWQSPTHTAVGASTAVFAALGLLAALSWTRRRHSEHRGGVRWAPLCGGVMLLAYTGFSGVRTDVGAHVTGFVAGLLFGGVYGVLGAHLRLPWVWQWLLGAAAVTTIAVAWLYALQAHG